MERYHGSDAVTEVPSRTTERKTGDDNAPPENLEALKKLRRHMPVNIKNMKPSSQNQPTPNGKFRPTRLLKKKKFKRTNVLQCLSQPR
jgi:hypothetical protein